MGNAAAHISEERRKCIMSRDFKRLAKGQFSDRGPNLFGKSFEVEQRLWHGLERCGVPEVPFWKGSKSTSPRVAAIIGAFLSEVMQFSSTLAH